MKISKTVNDIQKQYNDLCDAEGGKGNGPKPEHIFLLLKNAGQKLNQLGHAEITKHLQDFPDRNPWHICFAMGLCWGHLAKDDPDSTYMDAATRVLNIMNTPDLDTAKGHHFERGPVPVEKSLRGGYQMFQDVKLPDTLPDTLEGFRRVQERWFSRILSPGRARPQYIGSWNATAIFLVAIFSKPELWSIFVSEIVTLPPNGPVLQSLKLLHQAGILSKAPEGSTLDDSAFEPGAIYNNNAIMTELITNTNGLNMIDLHSGLYMLGTKYPHSNQWA